VGFFCYTEFSTFFGDSPVKIVVTSKKPVLTAEKGRLPKDIPVEVSDLLGKQLIESGVAVLLEVKERIDRPFVDAGKMESLSALPAAQASTSETLNSSVSGAKKRGRPRKEASLSPTPPTE